jgi:hypothetical protein
MAEIYLMHHKHGVKIATMEMEAQYDEAHGWVRFDPENLVEDAVVEEVVEASNADLPELTDEANVMAEAPRRRGRPRVTKDE